MTDRAGSPPTSFSGHDRRRLAERLKQTSEVRLFRRVQAVLRVAEGEPLSVVAQRLHLSRRSVHRWVKIYLRRHQAEDLRDAPHTGRPRAADGLEARLAELLAQDPRQLGYRATTWTAALLTTHLMQECGCRVSERTLRRRLHEDGWRWKRPRYIFSQREAAGGRKKGHSPPLEAKTTRRRAPVYGLDLAALVSAPARRLVAGGCLKPWSRLPVEMPSACCSGPSI
jgi:transposase